MMSPNEHKQDSQPPKHQQTHTWIHRRQTHKTQNFNIQMFRPPLSSPNSNIWILKNVHSNKRSAPRHHPSSIRHWCVFLFRDGRARAAPPKGREEDNITQSSSLWKKKKKHRGQEETTDRRQQTPPPPPNTQTDHTHNVIVFLLVLVFFFSVRLLMFWTCCDFVLNFFRWTFWRAPERPARWLTKRLGEWSRKPRLHSKSHAEQWTGHWRDTSGTTGYKSSSRSCSRTRILNAPHTPEVNFAPTTSHARHGHARHGHGTRNTIPLFVDDTLPTSVSHFWSDIQKFPRFKTFTKKKKTKQRNHENNYQRKKDPKKSRKQISKKKTRKQNSEKQSRETKKRKKTYTLKKARKEKWRQKMKNKNQENKIKDKKKWRKTKTTKTWRKTKCRKQNAEEKSTNKLETHEETNDEKQDEKHEEK